MMTKFDPSEPAPHDAAVSHVHAGNLQAGNGHADTPMITERQQKSLPDWARSGTSPATLGKEIVELAELSRSDWHVLFDAVTSKLRQVGSEALGPSGSGSGSGSGNGSLPLQATLQDCADALAHLQAMVKGGTRSADGVADGAADRAAEGNVFAPPRYFNPAAAQTLATADIAATDEHTVALVMFDLEGFGQIVAEHGDDFADQLLNVAAARLRRSLRAQDIVSLKTHELACMLSGRLSQEQLNQLACKLFDAVAAPIQIDSVQFTLRPSLGIALGAQAAADEGILGEQARKAMRRAKQLQSGYAFFTECGPAWFGGH